MQLQDLWKTVVQLVTIRLTRLHIPFIKPVSEIHREIEWLGLQTLILVTCNTASMTLIFPGDR